MTDRQKFAGHVPGVDLTFSIAANSGPDEQKLELLTRNSSTAFIRALREAGNRADLITSVI